MKRKQAGARSLRDAIETYRTEHERKVDREALDLLSRLAKSTLASQAFLGLALSRAAEEQVLVGCIEADKLARNFLRLVQKQEDALSRSEQWDKALVKLRKFAAEISEEKESLRLHLANLDLWSSSIFESPADSDAVADALNLIARAVEWRRGIAQANLVHLGATRKKGKKSIETAAENAAIWVLAASVYDAVRTSPLPFKRGKDDVYDPHVAEIAHLAQVILRTAKITEDRVREVRRGGRTRYLKMFSAQTKRHIADKASQGRSRDRG